MLSLSTSSLFATTVGRQAEAVERSLQKLSSGVRINRAADDPAGLSIADGYKALIQGSEQAVRNINDAINIVRIGQDGVAGIFPIVDRMRELILQAANGTASPEDKNALQNELDSLKNLIPDAFQVAHSARIDLDGKDNADRILHFQVGPNANEMISVDYNPLRDMLHRNVLDIFGYEDLYNSKYGEMLVAAFGSPAPEPDDPVPPIPPFTSFPPGTTFAQAFPKKLVVDGTAQQMGTALNIVDQFKLDIVGQAAYLGSITNRLESTLMNVQTAQINLTASESQIRDVDMALELSQLTKAQVIEQSAQAMLAQANARPFRVLELLRPQ